MHDRLDPEFVAGQRRLQVGAALAEDLGQDWRENVDADRDLTACLVPAGRLAKARIITREDMVLCGRDWVEQVFRALDPGVSIDWSAQDGEPLSAGALVCTLRGKARALLTGERTALNFLQTLSGTATAVRQFAAPLAGTACRLLDTRKTLPLLRAAQKYAVQIGGGHNHRIGLFDAFLIKENHIAACGSIAAAVARARELSPAAPVEVEVESFAELEQALGAGADIIMLDEFADSDLARAVTLTAGRAKLEVSGNVSPDRLRTIAAAGIDYVSAGALTKHLRAIDLSMRVIME